MRIGPYELENNLMLAPMAGVTDRPFRQLCKRLGAGLVVSEMLSSNPKVWNTAKSQARMNHEGEEGIRSVQIAGADPELMAQAAQFNVENGAQIIDINMGCPAKKVNKKLAGSALLDTKNSYRLEPRKSQWGRDCPHCRAKRHTVACCSRQNPSLYV